MIKIAVVEDDIHLLETIQEFLEHHQYEVLVYHSGIDFVIEAEYKDLDLLILDLSLDDVDGFYILEYLQSIDFMGTVLVLSGLLDVEYIEKAFHLGAKDYLKKPLPLKELHLRIERILNPQEAIFLEENLKFIKSKKQLFCADEEIYLNPKQKDVLALFVRFPNEILTYEFIIASVWNTNDITNNTLATYIRDIRGFIDPVKIVNIPKIGYKMVL